MSPRPSPAPFVRTHDCVASTREVPYILSDLTVRPALDQRNKTAVAMCTTVQAQQCDPNKYCCTNGGGQMNFAKVELIFNMECRDSLRMITFNGKQHQDLWGFYRDANPPVTALKWTDLLAVLPPSGPVGVELCWVMAPGACATPEAACYGGRCQASIFSSSNKCCPTRIL